MKNCVECNEPLEDDAKFCSNCRAEQPEKTIEPKETMAAHEEKACIRCGKCGKELRKESVACPYCGALVESQKNGSVIASSKEEATKMDYSLKCNSPPTGILGIIRSSSGDCRACKHLESIDDHGYYWCNHHKRSFRLRA